ncbi:MAG: hypothetical protein AAFP22_07750, partial [Planctomycetota bacterium]
MGERSRRPILLLGGALAVVAAFVAGFGTRPGESSTGSIARVEGTGPGLTWASLDLVDPGVDADRRLRTDFATDPVVCEPGPAAVGRPGGRAHRIEGTVRATEIRDLSGSRVLAIPEPALATIAGPVRSGSPYDLRPKLAEPEHHGWHVVDCDVDGAFTIELEDGEDRAFVLLAGGSGEATVWRERGRATAGQVVELRTRPVFASVLSFEDADGVPLEWSGRMEPPFGTRLGGGASAPDPSHSANSGRGRVQPAGPVARALLDVPPHNASIRSVCVAAVAESLDASVTVSGAYNLSGTRAPYAAQLRPVRDGVHHEVVTLSVTQREYPPTTVRFPEELVRAARAAEWPIRVEVTGVGRYVVDLADGQTEWTTTEIPPTTTRVFAFLWLNQWLYALPPGADRGPGSDAYVEVGHAPVLLELPELEAASLELELPATDCVRIGTVRIEGPTGPLFARGPTLRGAAAGATVRFPVVW